MTASSYEIIRCYIERLEYKEHIWLQRLYLVSCEMEVTQT